MTFHAGESLYVHLVGSLLRVSLIVMLLYAGLLGLTFWQAATTPTSFIPQQDKGYLLLNVQLPDSASVERTEKIMAKVESIVRKTKGVEHTMGISGQSLILAPTRQSRLDVRPAGRVRQSQRRPQSVGRRHLRRNPRALPKGSGGRDRLGLRPPPIDGLGTTGGFKIIIEDRGNLGTGELQQASDRIVSAGNRTPGLQGLFNSSRVNTPWLYLDIDRTKCMALGVQVSEVFNTLQIYFGSYYVNNFNEFGRTWQVNIQADQGFRKKVSDVLQLQVRNNQGQMIRLGADGRPRRERARPRHALQLVFLHRHHGQYGPGL